MNKKGFTLIELLIVVAIIGIIAAIAIPNLLVALQKGKQKATMGDLKSLGTGIESYITDWAFSPKSPAFLTSTTSDFFHPFYIKILPSNDGWGHPFGYVAGTATAPDEYSVFSSGRDGTATAATAPNADGLYVCTQIGDFAKDICFSDGYFTIGPDVKR